MNDYCSFMFYSLFNSLISNPKTKQACKDTEHLCELKIKSKTPEK